MNSNLFSILAIVLYIITVSSSKSVVKSKVDRLSPADLDKEVLLDDPDDYDDDDVLDLPIDEQKQRLRNLVEKKIDTDKDGFVNSEELYQWTLKAYDRFEVDDLREEIQIVDENKDGEVSWKEHCADVYGQECAEQEDCFVDPVTDEDKANAFNYNKDKLLFKAANLNGDGTLDFAEYVVFKHPRRSEATSRVVVQSKLDQLDSDKDGALTLEEFLMEIKDQTIEDKTHKMEEERFKEELDTDGNGKLDDAEILNWLEPNNEGEASDESEHLMSECDTDNNQKLSVDEILNNHSIWVDSDATDYGRYLLDHDEL